MKQKYKNIAFKPATLRMIETCNDIIESYQRMGFTLTVRQLYYQLVAKDLIPNTVQSYKTITGVVNDGRMAGLLDWDAIEDRTRDFVRRQRWTDGAQILEASARSFHIDMWDNQYTRPIVIVEKEALVGVLQQVCYEFDVPLLAARGYPSGTVLREFVEKDVADTRGEQEIVILHLGDHDPSGIDMSRDLEERIKLFAEEYDTPIELDRLALNFEQIAKLKPPPNPAKATDSRFASYRKKYGTKSWELDAIPPPQLVKIAREAIERYIDDDLWQVAQARCEDVQDRIRAAAKSFINN
jgi:hypothetical protein